MMRISPTRGPVEMREELTFAPKKKQASIIKYLNEDLDTVKRNFMSQDPSPSCCYSNTPETVPAMPDDNAMPMESMPLIPDDNAMHMEAMPLMPDDNATPMEIVPAMNAYSATPIGSRPMMNDDKVTPMETNPYTYDNSWLDKYCMQLGYHSLGFLTTPYGNAEVLARAAACAGIDDLDGCIPANGFKIIKATIVVLLEHLINKKLKELCQGCEIDHPSQLRHSCLFEPSAYFFDAYFEELSRNLVKPELKHIIAQALNRCGLRINPQRIQGSVDAILCELRDEVYIVEKLCEIRERVVDTNSEQIVYDAVDCWKGGAYTGQV
ncbi:hypothetical protein QQF64_014611 [Cirrhinus molitorella]|uniref:Uncharacterized protein n=1 Tax=Cirrhinus molitorella TaxID=172907 RepID=A0ABR3NTT1_9TELE